MKKRLIQLALITLFIPLILFAEDKKEEKKPVYGWIKETIITLNYSQSKFDNWSRGGENTLTWQAELRAKFEKNEIKYNWLSKGYMVYGKTQVAEERSKKAFDELRLESVYTYKMGVHVNPYASFTGLTQFTPGYEYTDSTQIEVSNFWDPAFLTESIGFGFKIGETFKTRFGAALKQTITRIYNSYSDDPDTPKIEKLDNSIGAESVTDLQIKFTDDIIYISMLQLFSDFSAIDEVDVRWNNLFVAKLLKYVSVSFTFNLAYDKNISYKREIQQVFAIGFTYSLF
jgi:hypothetical protein